MSATDSLRPGTDVLTLIKSGSEEQCTFELVCGLRQFPSFPFGQSVRELRTSGMLK
jgi:hypothetical protein